MKLKKFIIGVRTIVWQFEGARFYARQVELLASSSELTVFISSSELTMLLEPASGEKVERAFASLLDAIKPDHQARHGGNPARSAKPGPRENCAGPGSTSAPWRVAPDRSPGGENRRRFLF